MSRRSMIVLSHAILSHSSNESHSKNSDAGRINCWVQGSETKFVLTE